MNEEESFTPVEIKSSHSKTPIISKTEKEYGKLAAVIVAIYLVSVVTFLVIGDNGPFKELNQVQAFAAQFMGVFFIVFGSFKLVNLKSFVHGFQMYDLIAKRSDLYAKAYPFVQIALGLAMFLIPSFAFTHFVAMIVSGLALAGVLNSLMNKQKIQCACLGNVIKMPLATVSGIEDGSMFVISFLMFIAMIVS